MTVSILWKAIRSGRLLVASSIVVGLLTAAGFYALHPSTYTATVNFYVSAQGGDTAERAYQGAQLSELRVRSFVDIIEGKRLAGAVRDDLQLSASVESVQGRISASAPLDSVVITTLATGETPDQAGALADAIGRNFPLVVQDVEGAERAGVPAPVIVRPVDQAQVSAGPTSTGLTSMLALGLLAGAVVGSAAAYARHVGDKTLREADDISSEFDRPILGTIPTVPRKPEGLLDAFEAKHQVLSEPFRQLRAALRFSEIDLPPRTLAILSPDEGDGRTSVAFNLAVAASLGGLSVAVVDADLGRPALRKFLSREDASSRANDKYVLGLRALRTAYPRLTVLTTTRDSTSEAHGLAYWKVALDQLGKSFDLVIIDTPPALSDALAVRIATTADGALLVCRAGRTTKGHMRATLQTLEQSKVRTLGIVFNDVTPQSGSSYDGYYSSYLQNS